MIGPWPVRLIRAVVGWMRGQRAGSRAGEWSPATYFIDARGSDANAGTSPHAAWRTLARANRHRFGPGDRVLLRGGEEFEGPVSLGGDSVGTPDRPIVVGSFGTGRATIRVASGSAVIVRNLGGVHITELDVRGGRKGSDIDSGIAVRNGLPGDVRLASVRIDHVEVSGFTGDGIAVGGVVGKSGFRDVLIEHASVHDNARNGVTIFGEWSGTSREYANEHVVIRFVSSFNNSGIPGQERPHSGSGIVVSDVNHGLVERCLAFNNGWLSDSLEGGPIGIWAHDSNDITIQHNESYGNRTGGGLDGGGFDLDGGVTNSVVQYNYSHDNDGAGYLLAQYDCARPFGGNAVRYNISQNDCRRNAYGAIHGFGDIATTDIHNNSVYVGAGGAGHPAAVVIAEGARRGIRVMNNILMTEPGVPSVIASQTGAGLLFRGNNYYAGGAPLAIAWQSETFTSLDAWRRETGQESAGDREFGHSVDPRLAAAGCAPVLGDPALLETIEAYRPMAGSPVAGGGIDLDAAGVRGGDRDFRGTVLQARHRSDVGALVCTEQGLTASDAADAGAAGGRIR